MTDNNLAVIGHRITALETDRNEILQVLKELNVAVNKLVIIDERQVQAALIMDRLVKTTDRAHERIDDLANEMGDRIDRAKSECMNRDTDIAKSVEDMTSALGKSVGALRSEAAATHKHLEGRIDELEKAEVENKRVRGWVFALMALIGVGVAGALLKVIGLSV